VGFVPCKKRNNEPGNAATARSATIAPLVMAITPRCAACVDKRMSIDVARIAVTKFIGFSFALAILLAAFGARADAVPERVTFLSADGGTLLTGYLFVPAHPGAARGPAVVMMHGRAGAYSTNANGRYDATTLSQRHAAWGRLWAEQGYVALMVDGFGPRGYAQGFPRFSYGARPAELNEVTVRPLDAYGALAYLRARPDVAADRIGLQGWSNGGSATLAAMASGAASNTGAGFRAALAFYPACALKGQFDSGYLPYAPVQVFQGTADEEVSPRRCNELVERSKTDGGAIGIRLYRGATHGFDDPGSKRQRIDENAAATEDAVQRSLQFFAKYLGGPAGSPSQQSSIARSPCRRASVATKPFGC
jgi:dienelactone hydrolase